MKEVYANNIIQKTKRDYNNIAEHFDLSRVKTFIHNVRAWHGMRMFLQYVSYKDKVLDFGCGNGRFFEVLKEKNVEYIGVDQSCALIKRAKILYPNTQFFCMDNLPLLFSNAHFNSIFSIAVLHHIPSFKKRKEVVVELGRMLKTDGKIIITVWNLWQKKYICLIFKHTVYKVLGQIFSYFYEYTKLDFFDIFIPWKDKDKNITAQRYYHCFYKYELERLVLKAGMKIEKSGYFGGRDGRANIYIIARK